MKSVLVVLGMACLVACTPPKTKRTSILIDVTEVATPQVTINDTNQVGYPEGIWDGSTVRYSLIKDVSYTHTSEVILESEESLTSNEHQRRQSVNEFKDQLHQLGHTDSLEYDYSFVWEPLMTELNYLSEEDIPTTVYLVSDLMEHTSHWVSFYDTKTLNELDTYPEKLRQTFMEKTKGMKALHHISLVIVHEPEDATKNILFTKIIEEVYRPICEDSLGMDVSIQAKL